jgi:hypothetical protein
MKNYYNVLLFTGILFSLTACKKAGSQTIAAVAVPYPGKYQETKFSIYQTLGPTVVTDTTYSSSAFSANDYARFVNDTCYVSSDYTFDPRTASTKITMNSTAAMQKFNYSLQHSGDFYILSNPQPILQPSGVYQDTLQWGGGNTWVIHTVYVPGYYPAASFNVLQTSTDAYYTMP